MNATTTNRTTPTAIISTVEARPQQETDAQYGARAYGNAQYPGQQYSGQYATDQYAPQYAAPAPARPSRSQLDQTRYWVGAGLTALIATLAGLIGLVIAQGILHVSIMLPSGSHLTPMSTTLYGLSAAGIAILAAGLFDGMVYVAPRPLTYYTWLTGIVTVLAVVLPFTTAASLHSQIALGATNLVVGLLITFLVPVAAHNARS